MIVEAIEEPKGKEEMGFDSVLKALNDLEKEQREMLNEIKMQNQERSTHWYFLFGETSGAS